MTEGHLFVAADQGSSKGRRAQNVALIERWKPIEVLLRLCKIDIVLQYRARKAHPFELNELIDKYFSHGPQVTRESEPAPY
jgi:hypothetical protein